MNKQFRNISLSVLSIGLLIQVVPAQANWKLLSLLGIGGAGYYAYTKGQKIAQKDDSKGTEYTHFDLETCKKNIESDLYKSKEYITESLDKNKVGLGVGLTTTIIYNAGLFGMLMRSIISERVRNISSWVFPAVAASMLYNRKDDIKNYFVDIKNNGISDNQSLQEDSDNQSLQEDSDNQSLQEDNEISTRLCKESDKGARNHQK